MDTHPMLTYSNVTNITPSPVSFQANAASSKSIWAEEAAPTRMYEVAAQLAWLDALQNDPTHHDTVVRKTLKRQQTERNYSEQRLARGESNWGIIQSTYYIMSRNHEKIDYNQTAHDAVVIRVIRRFAATWQEGIAESDIYYKIFYGKLSSMNDKEMSVSLCELVKQGIVIKM